VNIVQEIIEITDLRERVKLELDIMAASDSENSLQLKLVPCQLSKYEMEELKNKELDALIVPAGKKVRPKAFLNLF